MRYFLAIVFAICFVVPVHATTVSFNVDPSMTGIVFVGEAYYPDFTIRLSSSNLATNPLTGQNLSIDAVFADDVLMRLTMLVPTSFDIGLHVTTGGPVNPGLTESTTVFLLDGSGSPASIVKDGGSTTVGNNAFFMSVGRLTRADVNGATSLDLRGVHFDTTFSDSEHAITSAELVIYFHSNRAEFGTVAQLPEPPSLALLPLGLIAISMVRRRAIYRSAPAQ